MARRRDYDDEDADRPRRRRDEDDGDSRRRRYDDDEDDEDDDRPFRRRATRPRPQGRPTLLVLGILGGVVFLCSGLGGFVYFAVILPRIEAGQRAGSQPPPYQTMAKPVDPKLSQLRKGMTRAEVEAVLGPLRPAERKDLSYVTNVLPDGNQVVQRWHDYMWRGQVYAWRANRDCVLVNFDADPAAGGKLSAVLASMDSSGFHGELSMFDSIKR